MNTLKNKSIPAGLAKKPGAMPPGQFKKEWQEATTLDLSQVAEQMYLDPEAVVESLRYSQDATLMTPGVASSNKEYNRNMALTAKGYHPAKVPHPLLTHFIRK
jgi:hypothetical protein